MFFFDPQKEYYSAEQIDTANDSCCNHVDVPLDRNITKRQDGNQRMKRTSLLCHFV